MISWKTLCNMLAGKSATRGISLTKDAEPTSTVVRGYKATQMDMTCRDIQFELGKSYTLNGKIKLCDNGFHFCKNLINVFNYYYVHPSKNDRYHPYTLHHYDLTFAELHRDPIRIFEVEASGDIDSDGDKSCARTIKFIKEVSIEQLVQLHGDNDNVACLAIAQNRCIDHYASKVNHPYAHKLLAHEGLALDQLATSSEVEIRRLVAKKGHALDTLLNDSDSVVRTIIANRGYRLDVLVYDTDVEVRRAVARQGFGFEILVRDPDSSIREIVATAGYGLDILVNDTCIQVRQIVAKHGYYLGKLLYDECWEVRMVVAARGVSLGILMYDTNEHVRAVVAEQGYRLDILVNDLSPVVRRSVINYLKSILPTEQGNKDHSFSPL